MCDHSITQIEQLTDELRQLVGRGAKPMRLVSCPILRDLADVDSSLSIAQMGSAIHHYLVDGIKSMNGVYEFQGKPLDAAKLCWCLRLLFEIEGVGQSAEKRRERVHHILGLRTALGQFRKPHSPERKLLRLLAVHLVAQSGRNQIAE